MAVFRVIFGGRSPIGKTLIRCDRAYLGSAMNVGSHNHNQTRAHQNMGVSATDLKELFAELHKSIDTLPTEQQEEATELVNALEEEAQSQNPRKAIVQACAQQLGKFLRDAAANTLGTIVGALL